MAVNKAKLNMLYTLLQKMWLRERDGQQTYTALYTTMATVALSQFNSEEELKKFVYDVPIDMIFIKTQYKEHNIYTTYLDTYSYTLSILNIRFTNTNKIERVQLI